MKYIALSYSTIAIILGILIFALLLWACSRNAIVVGERQEREFRRGQSSRRCMLGSTPGQKSA